MWQKELHSRRQFDYAHVVTRRAMPNRRSGAQQEDDTPALLDRVGMCLSVRSGVAALLTSRAVHCSGEAVRATAEESGRRSTVFGVLHPAEHPQCGNHVLCLCPSGDISSPYGTVGYSSISDSTQQTAHG